MRLFEVKTSSNTVLTEGIIHPEDKIWTDGIAGAKDALDGLRKMSTGKELTTIKWDGFPALIFGRDADGRLIITDKHMFDKKDEAGIVRSPEEFQQYDVNRGANRNDLWEKINILWPLLEQIIPKGFKGFYWGDLLYTGKLTPSNGYFVFKPNTVTYKVKADSQVGKNIAGSSAGIAVHGFIPGIGQQDHPLNGLGGLPAGGAPVWFATGEMPTPKVTIDKAALTAAQNAISKYDSDVHKFLTELTAIKAKGLLGLGTKYINSKITQGSLTDLFDGFYDYLNMNLSGAMNKKLLGDTPGSGWLYNEGKTGMYGMFAIWTALYNLKLNVKRQIDAQQANNDVQAYTGEDPGHEGYVVGGGKDKFKLIDRLGFSKENFNKVRT